MIRFKSEPYTMQESKMRFSALCCFNWWKYEILIKQFNWNVIWFWLIIPFNRIWCGKNVIILCETEKIENNNKMINKKMTSKFTNAVCQIKSIDSRVCFKQNRNLLLIENW